MEICRHLSENCNFLPPNFFPLTYDAANRRWRKRYIVTHNYRKQWR